ncbi:lysophospholipase [Paenibacillus sp. PK3_47]|uniref:GDSL-type esterase/lipase family protein n=1 Tax=Paenibacillus sp. PK3_47 TaxID=2072642 RepID=UPI00201DC750|nr:GDSL-type esterase/lipase family protein [Paenibacillus sp. PK3_47]UQZ32334.1 lysophospholipase [Paenibacillus sp. PK3_47]
MNDSRWTWRSVSLISIAATVILIAGFVYAVNDILHPKGEALLTSLPQETAAPAAEVVDEYRILALGDSLAKGTGDNSGNGFVRRTVEGLSADGLKAALLGNMGINGQTTAGLLSSLKEEGVQYAVRQANIILLSIGGNDLFQDSGITGTPDDEELTPQSLLAALPEASKRLGDILQYITELNPQAQIYYVGLYNPFGDVPDLLVPGNQAVTLWNNAAMDIMNTHSNMTLVPTFDLFNRHLDKYLSGDHFHPNEEGYQRMGERIVQAVR